MKTTKRIAAWVCIIILLVLYVSTIVLSFFKGELAHKMFIASAYATVAVPVVIYGYMKLYAYLNKLNKRGNKSKEE